MSSFPFISMSLRSASLCLRNCSFQTYFTHTICSAKQNVQLWSFPIRSHCTNEHENLTKVVWLCIIIKNFVCLKKGHLILIFSQSLDIFSSLKLCLHFEEFQPTYTYAIKVMLIKKWLFQVLQMLSCCATSNMVTLINQRGPSPNYCSVIKLTIFLKTRKQYFSPKFK